jgi:hypothetical protein
MGQRFDIVPLARHNRVEVDAGQSVVFEFAREFFRELRGIKEGFDRYCHSIPPQSLGNRDRRGSRCGIYSVKTPFYFVDG